MNKKNIIIISVVVIALISVLIIRSIIIGRMEKARDAARAKSCAATQRILTGATEMYNMDHPEMLTSLNVKALLTPSYNPYTKKNESYLREDPTKNDFGCEYASKGDLTQDGYIYCKKHGSVEEIVNKYGR